jgi:hypothetical protein
MRIGKGDIVALRILAGVPVAIGFAFLGLMVWTSIDPPPPQQEPDPQAKARARIAVDYCIQNEIRDHGRATKSGVEKCLVNLPTRR